MTDPKDKQVREKLIARGAEALSDVELLSILLGSGRDGGAALDLAVKVLANEQKESHNQSESGFAALARMELSGLRMVGGMGVTRAATLCAAFEAGRRLANKETSLSEIITGDADIIRMFRPILASLAHEEFWVVYLSAGNRIIEKVRISQGGVSGTVVDHKLIVKRAVERLSSAIIVVHNHPSGIAAPSDEDIAITRKLETAASLFEITLLDHLIITPGENYSFRQHGLIGKS